MLRGNTPGSVRCSQLHFQCCHCSIADLRCAPLAMDHHSLNAHIEWIEYTAWHDRHVQVAINDEKQKRMINRDLYGLRLRTGVAWPGEGSSYCTFVLTASMMLLPCSAAIATAGGANTVAPQCVEVCCNNSSSSRRCRCRGHLRFSWLMGCVRMLTSMDCSMCRT